MVSNGPGVRAGPQALSVMDRNTASAPNTVLSMGRSSEKSPSLASLFRRRWWPLWVAILLILSGEFLARLLEPRLKLAADSDSFVWSEKLALLSSRRLSGVQTIIVGDSQAMSGVVPAELEGPVYNLALPSLQPEGLLPIAADFSQLPQLRRVVVNISPYSAFQSEVAGAFLTYAKAELLPVRPLLLFERPGLEAKSAGDQLDLALFGLSALYRSHRYGQLIASFERRISTVPLSVVRKNPALADKQVLNQFLASTWMPLGALAEREQENLRTRELLASGRGYWTWNSRALPTVQSCAPQGSRFEGAPVGGWQTFRPRPRSEVAWRDLLSELASRGYLVHVVQIPLSSVWSSTTQSREVYARLDSLLGRIRETLPKELQSRIVFHPREAHWDTGDAHLFHDWTHLSYCGALQYTRALRAKMAAAERALPQTDLR